MKTASMPHKKPASHEEKKKIPTFGTRAQVFHGNALKTTGGLFQKDLKKNEKTGRIVSRKASEHSAKAYHDNGLKPASKNTLARIRLMKNKKGASISDTAATPAVETATAEPASEAIIASA